RLAAAYGRHEAAVHVAAQDVQAAQAEDEGEDEAQQPEALPAGLRLEEGLGEGDEPSPEVAAGGRHKTSLPRLSRVASRCPVLLAPRPAASAGRARRRGDAGSPSPPSRPGELPRGAGN